MSSGFRRAEEKSLSIVATVRRVGIQAARARPVERVSAAWGL
jgi:hypothetical protein